MKSVNLKYGKKLNSRKYVKKGSYRYLFNIIIFVSLILTLGFLNVVTPDNQIVSESENRKLTKLPRFTLNSLFKGKFSPAFENYFSDNFISRENFIKMADGIKELKGFSPRSGVSVVAGGINQGEGYGDAGTDIHNPPLPKDPVAIRIKFYRDYYKPDREKFVSWQKENSYYPEMPDPPRENFMRELPVDSGKGNIVNHFLLIGNELFEIFVGDPQGQAYYAKALNNFYDAFDGKVKVYSAVIPSHIEFVDPNIVFSPRPDPQDKATDYIHSGMPNVIPVDVYTQLNKHRGEYIYFRTDHHWTAKGAYYAYTAFAKKAGFRAVPLKKYKTVKVENFLGTLYNGTKSARVAETPDTVTIYKPFVENTFTIYDKNGAVYQRDVIHMGFASKGNKYLVFISGDIPLGIIKTEKKNGKKIIVLKDSYGNAFIPFLIPHYEEIYIVDPRYYTGSVKKLVNDNGIQEALFINYMMVIGYHTGFARAINNSLVR